MFINPNCRGQGPKTGLFINFQGGIAGLEQQVSSLKSSLQDKTTKLATSQETLKRLEDQLHEVRLVYVVTVLFPFSNLVSCSYLGTGVP